MDPNATSREMNEQLIAATKQAERQVEDLAEWLAKGGFEPEWDKFPLATKYYMERHHERRT